MVSLGRRPMDPMVSQGDAHPQSSSDASVTSRCRHLGPFSETLRRASRGARLRPVRWRVGRETREDLRKTQGKITENPITKETRETPKETAENPRKPGKTQGTLKGKPEGNQ